MKFQTVEKIVIIVWIVSALITLGMIGLGVYFVVVYGPDLLNGVINFLNK